MKISLIAVGKLKEKYLKEGIEEYKKRLSRFCELEIIEVEDEKAPEALSHAQGLQIKKKEAEKVLKRVKEGSYAILLDVSGEKPGSEEFAGKLKALFLSGQSHMTFIIGGSLGLDDLLIKASNYRLSLSNLTFPHQLARLVFLEQLYRAFKIIHGETYHK